MDYQALYQQKLTTAEQAVWLWTAPWPPERMSSPM